MASKKVVSVKSKSNKTNPKSSQKVKPSPSKSSKKSGSKRSSKRKSTNGVERVFKGELIYGQEAYKWMIGGILLIALGMILMIGGAMPSPEVWDPSLIYSPRRITIAPIVILAGLALEFVAIFKVVKS